MKKKTLATSLLTALAVTLPAQAAPGDLCKALLSPQSGLSAVQAAVAAGEGPNTICRNDGCDNDTALVCSVRHGWMPRPDEIPLYLASLGADPNALNQENYAYHKYRNLTTLQWVARDASLEVLETLLSQKPDVDFAPLGITALGFALEGRSYSGGQWSNVEALLAAGADPYRVEFSLSNGAKSVTETALSKILLSRSAPQALVDKLLAGWKFEQDSLDRTQIYLARLLASRNRTQAGVAFLIGKGAKADSLRLQDGSTENALTYLAEHVRLTDRPTLEAEDARIADYLLSLGLDAGEKHGKALVSAVNAKAGWLASRLLEKGLSANTRSGTVPVLALSAALNDVVNIRLLLAHGARIDLEDSASGHTALVKALHAGDNLEAINELIGQGADVNHLDKEGRTPLCLAKLWGRQDAAVVLLSKGASLGSCSRER